MPRRQEKRRRANAIPAGWTSIELAQIFSVSASRARHVEGEHAVVVTRGFVRDRAGVRRRVLGQKKAVLLGAHGHLDLNVCVGARERDSGAGRDDAARIVRGRRDRDRARAGLDFVVHFYGVVEVSALGLLLPTRGNAPDAIQRARVDACRLRGVWNRSRDSALDAAGD